MVRESRHLWVGNLPEAVREEQIQDYFSRYGRVEKVKLLPKTSPDGGRAAFVDFVDIRSATKANEAPSNRMGERELRTNYNEPGKVPEYGRLQQPVHRIHGAPGYPAGLEYRGQPVVIYTATPPAEHIIHSAASYRPVYQRDDRRITTYKPRKERGRSPVGRGSGGRALSVSSLSDGDQSPNLGKPDCSSDSDDSSGKNGKACTVLVKCLLARSSDTSLEEALYHEFKKVGEIVNIKIKGIGPERYAYIKFSKSEEAERATNSSGKLFLGQEMKVTLRGQSHHHDNGDLVFDPHATRTVFVGNLEKTMMHGELRNIFERFGEVVDVDIKKMQTGITTYSFVQYIDINGAMLARKKMDRQYIGHNRIKVGYGRGTPTNSLWVGNLPTDVTEHQLAKAFHPFGYVQRCLIDKHHWQALVRFETIESSTRAFAEMHGKHLLSKRLAVDYASPACRDGFYSRMEKRGLLDRRELEPSPTPPDAHINFQNVARGGAFAPRGNFTTRPATYPATTYVSRELPKDYIDSRSARYSERPRSIDYDKELRDYNYGRDKSRERPRGYSPMSRGSSSPRQRTTRESISPVSSAGFYNDKKAYIKAEKEKKKKRKRSIADSPPPFVDEPPKKKEKKKKKDKKEKLKKQKATKGSIDFGYDINEEEEPTTVVSQEKTKADLKKEKKERRKAEKAEKLRKKVEKKEKKMEKLKSMELSSKETNAVEEEKKETLPKYKNRKMETDSTEIVNNNETPLEKDKVNLPEENKTSENCSEHVQEKGDENNGTKLESVPEVKPATAIESVTEGEGLFESEPRKSAAPDNQENAMNETKDAWQHSKTEEISESEAILDESEKDRTDNLSEKLKSEQNHELSEQNKIEASELKQVVPSEVINNSTPDTPPTPNLEEDIPKKAIIKKAVSENPVESEITKDSSDSTSSSCSSDSTDSNDSSDDDDDKDLKHRSYRHNNNEKERSRHRMSERDVSNNRLHERKPCEQPKAYRQDRDDDYDRKDYRSSRTRETYRDREYTRSKYPETRRSPPAAYGSRRGISPSGRSSDCSKSSSVRDRSRSRSPYSKRESSYDRRRGQSPLRKSPRSVERRDSSYDSRNGRGVPPPPPPNESLQKTVEVSYPNQIPSNVPRQPTGSSSQNADTLLDLLRRFPVTWQGLIGLKNDTAAVQMHFLSGNVRLAEAALPRGAQPPLRISQRMKLETSQLEGVDKRIQQPKEHCMLLALPCGRDPLDVHAQTRALKTGFITYLQQKQAAGIINMNDPTTKQTAYVVHIFPPCDFAQDHLGRVAPDLLDSAADSGHLMILITPV